MWGTSTKRNIYPDVLATFLDRKALFEAGPVQLSFIVFQRENQLNIIVLVQNLHDAATEVQMNFLVEFSSQSSPMIFPSLKCDVGASSVIIADYGYPCSPKQLQGQLVKITPTITTKAKQNSRVRFNQRQVFDTKVKLWLSYLMLVGPTVIFSGERFYTLRLNPVAQGKATSVLRPWTVQEVWSPVIRKPKEDIIKIIDSRMGEATP